MEEPLVSVVISTYNHKNFISQTIESVLMQKTSFPIEIIIGEDESKDGTREICIEYANNYPDKIRLFLRSRKDVIYVNKKPTGRYNFIENLKSAQGKYIAWLPGDDYWTDPLKLQTQVDFLEANPEFSICYHNAEERYEDATTPSFLYVTQKQPLVSGLNDLAYLNFIPSCSAVFRNRFLDGVPDWYNQVPVGDWPMHMINAHFGKIGYIPKVMGAHRLHVGGIWSKNSQFDNLQSVIDTYDILIEAYSSELQFKENLIAGRERIVKSLQPSNNKPTKEPMLRLLSRKLKSIIKMILPKVIFNLIKPRNKMLPLEKIDKMPSHMRVGNSLLFKNFFLNTRVPKDSKIYLKIGDDSMIGGMFTFESSTGEVIIGNRVYLAGGNIICTNRIEIEDDVFISWGVYFFDNDSHSLDYRDRLADMKNHLNDWRSGLENYNISKDWSKVKSAPIKICKYSWIGMECKILKGVTIGEGAIVGAGSVVVKDVEPWTIVAGNPAKFIRSISVKERKR